MNYKCSHVKTAIEELDTVLSAVYEPKGYKTVEEPVSGDVKAEF